MPEQVITAELRRWIVAQAEAGCQPDTVVASMVRSGWTESVALQAMESTLSQRLDEIAAERHAATAPAGPVPEPDLAQSPNGLLVDGHLVQVVVSLQRPRVVVFGNFLSHAECDALVERARPRLSRSETVDTSTGVVPGRSGSK